MKKMHVFMEQNHVSSIRMKENIMATDIKAFIFDLDGVITDTAELHYKAWQKMSDEEGYFFNREINEKLRGVSRRASLEIILDGKVLPEEKMEALMKKKNDDYKELLETITSKDILPGVEAMLKDLKERGIKIALASASRNARPILEKLGIIGLFDAIGDGNSVVRAKPEPDVFIHAAGQVGVDVLDCLVVEDAEAGVKGAKDCGMKAIGIGPQSRVGRADFIYATPGDIDLVEVLGE